jgi:hypothetical protein
MRPTICLYFLTLNQKMHHFVRRSDEYIDSRTPGVSKFPQNQQDAL